MRASSTRYVVCWALVVVVCAGVGDGQSIADEGPTTPGACTFNAKIIDPPDIIAELLSFPNLKSLIGSRFSGNATVVTLELSFPCRAILPTHCCKVKASLRSDNAADLDALESVRQHRPTPPPTNTPTPAGVCAVCTHVVQRTAVYQTQVHSGTICHTATHAQRHHIFLVHRTGALVLATPRCCWPASSPRRASSASRPTQPTMPCCEETLQP